MAEVPMSHWVQVEQYGSIPVTCSLFNALGRNIPNREESKNELIDLLNKLAIEINSNQDMRINMTEKTNEITMLTTNCEMLQRQCEKLENELSECKTRLSKMMGNKLTDNNPAIADLSDSNRPVKLAEQFSELYDNQWTDAFQAIDDGKDEQETIEILLRILVEAYEMCKEESQKQAGMLRLIARIDIDSLKYPDELSNQTDNHSVPKTVQFETERFNDNVFMPGQAPNHLEINKQIKEFRKSTAHVGLDNLFQKLLRRLTLFGRDSQNPNVQLYIKECVQICWFMNILEPPVVFSQEPERFENFNTELYRSYTKSGSSIQYLVWPAMFLH